MKISNHKIFKSGSIWKTCRLFVWVITLGIYCYIIYLIGKYHKYETLMSHTLEHEPFMWPQVTLCNPSAPFLMRHGSNEYKYWNELISRSKDPIQQMDGRLVFGQTDFKKQLVFAMSSADRRRLFNVSQMEHLFSIDYDLVFPNKMLDGVYRDIEINPRSFIQFIDNIPCYTIDLNQPKIAIRKSDFSDQNGEPKFKWDTVDGITLNLMIGDENYNSFNSNIVQRPIDLYLSNVNELSGIKKVVTSDMDTMLICTENNYQYLGFKNKCRRDKFQIDLYDPFLSATKFYEGNYKDCVQVALQEFSVQRCNCYNPLLPIYKNESGFPRLCFNLTMFNEPEMKENLKCLSNVSSDIYQDFPSLASFIFGKCEKFRVHKCTFRSYKIERRYSASVTRKRNVFNKKINQKMRFNNMTITFLRNSEYSELHKEEEKYSTFQFLADLGGLIGLSISLYGGIYKLAKWIDERCKKYKKLNHVPLSDC